MRSISSTPHSWSPIGDGYLAALVNFRFLASAVWTTAEAIEALARLKNGEFTSREAEQNGND